MQFSNALVESRFDFAPDTRISWWDEDSQCTIVISTPTLDPVLWSEFLQGAERSYRKHGVECALDVSALRRGGDTLMFWAALDDRGRMLGGMRAKGPLASADDAHAVLEWAGQPGLATVRKMIADRVPFGVLEMRAAWVTDDRSRSRAITPVFARSGSHAMALMDIQFCLATSAPHVLDRWASSGGVVAPVAATPYPDERYRTRMMWWDRRTYANHADSEQMSKIRAESRMLGQLAAVR